MGSGGAGVKLDREGGIGRTQHGGRRQRQGSGHHSAPSAPPPSQAGLSSGVSVWLMLRDVLLGRGSLAPGAKSRAPKPLSRLS